MKLCASTADVEQRKERRSKSGLDPLRGLSSRTKGDHSLRARTTRFRFVPLGPLLLGKSTIKVLRRRDTMMADRQFRERLARAGESQTTSADSAAAAHGFNRPAKKKK